MEFFALGPLEVVDRGKPVPIGGPKQQMVLAVLVARANQATTVDYLIDQLWGDEAPKAARNTLQSYVSNLRRVLGDSASVSIETVDAGYLLRVDDEAVDVRRFEALAGEGRSLLAAGDWTAARGVLLEALDLWQGAPFGVLADSVPLLREEAVRLEELRLAAVEDRVDADLALGSHGDAIVELESFTEKHPFRERPWSQLMLALYRSARQAEALRAYQKARRILGEELGIEPSLELKELEERILLQDPDLTLVEGETRPVHNLPAQVSSFVGRDQQLSDLAKLIDQSRLVTVTGVGGSGKTRLCLQLAGELMDRFPDGVWYVPLASLRDGSLIAAEMLGTLGLDSSIEKSHLEALCEQLAGRELLLVVDNCEHVLHDAAEVVVALLRAAPGVEVLATSRQLLGVAGETAWPLPPMALPVEGLATAEEIGRAEAVRLFVERATEARPGFVLDEGNASQVADICRRLDGLPLGIELAAARTRSLGIDEIDRRLGDRFHLLTGGDPTALPRQQTLLATVEWSYDLLDERTQELYRRLSVFAGGFSLDAAEAVGTSNTIQEKEVVDLLDHLVAQSLVTTEEAGTGMRYRMFETVRAHALDRAGESGEEESANTALLHWTAQLAAEAGQGIQGPDQHDWVARLQAEHDNIRAALSWALPHDPVTGLMVTTEMAHFWWFRPVGSPPRGVSRSQPYLLEGADRSRRMIEAAGDAAPAEVRARALTNLGGLLELRLGRVEEAEQHLREAEALLGPLDDPQAAGWAVFYRGWATWGRVPIAETVALYRRAVESLSKAGDRRGMIESAVFLGYALLVEGKHTDEAIGLIRQFDDVARQAEIPQMVAHASDFTAATALLHDTGEEVPPLLDKALRLFAEIDIRPCVSHVLQTTAMYHAKAGNPERAAELLGAAQGIRDRLIKVAVVMPSCEDRTAWVEELGLTELDPEARRAAFAAGRTMSYEEAVESTFAGLSVDA